MISVSPPTTIKTCCANLYENDWVRLLLGDSFHPGGLALTERLGELLGLQPGDQVLDVASGQGTSAVFLAERFGCQVIGVDYGLQGMIAANKRAKQAGVEYLVHFEQGDVETLHFVDASFDALICECAFCTFPNKRAAAVEFSRVLRPGGRIGLADLTRSGTLPPELSGLLAWITCIADARPVNDYIAHLHGARINSVGVEYHDSALAEMVQDVRSKLMGVELMLKLQGFPLSAELDLNQVKSIARHAARAISQGTLGYILLVGCNG